MKKLIVKSLLKDRAEFEKRAIGVGLQFTPKYWQHERVYLPHDYQPKMNYPRMVLKTEMREADKTVYIMELKRHLEQNGVDVVEATTVGDYTAATAIVQQLGFQKVAELARSRWEAVLANGVTVYLDEIEGMDGTFLKMEVMLEDESTAEEMRKELFEILKLLGQETFILQTYAELARGQMQPYYL